MGLINRLRQTVHALSPNCQEAVRRQSEALDHPLPPIQRIGLRIHLLLCKWCRRYGQQIRFLRAAARQRHCHPKANSGLPALTPAARERLKRALGSAMQ